MATFTVTEKKETLDFSRHDDYVLSFCNNASEVNSVVIDPDKTNNVGNAAILERSSIPDSHRRTADNFMIIKKIFGTPVIQCRITEAEKDFLAKYDLNPLEFSTSSQMKDELKFLRESSESGNKALKEDADKIIQIRSKELRHLIATNFVDIKNDLYRGYKVLEKYFEDITKYSIER